MTTITHGNKQTVSLPAQHVLSVIASEGGSGSVTRLGDRAGEQPQGVRNIGSEETVLFGPFNVPTQHQIACADWSLTYGVVLAQFTVDGASVPAIGLPGGFVEMFGDDAPVAPVQAELTTDLTGSNNDLVFTAVQFGERGNEISIEYVDPGIPSQALSVAVNGKRIIVSLATGAGETGITSTAALVDAAIAGSDEASALVDVDDASDNNGSGVVTEMARTFLADGAGTGVGVAGPGSRYTKLDDGVAVFVNTGDADQPAWVELTQGA